MTEERSHDHLIREQFSRQAANWDSYVVSGGNEDALAWSLENVELRPDMVVLDVAAGTGILARGMAPMVAQAFALDVTPEMVARGAELAAEEGLTNVTFDHGDARSLPYEDGSFSLVACRLAMHQVENPDLCLREMTRVCRSGGEVVIIDLTTSEDPATAETHNRLERLRDPSHTNALPASRHRAMAQECGLEALRAAFYDSQRNVASWMNMTQTPPESRAAILERLEAELSGGAATGMSPYRENGELMFKHRWIMLVGRKP